MKRIIVLSVFTLTAFTIQAQIRFGAKAGANFSTLTGSDATMDGNVSPKYKTGFAGGALVNVPLSNQFSLQPEVLYSMEGARYKEGEIKMDYKINFINIPVFAQYNHSSGFYAETGPQFGLLTSAKISSGDYSMSIKDNMKKFNLSWGFGAGYKLSSGLGIGARYQLGLTSIAEGDSDGEGDAAADVKSSGFHIGLFYTLSAGGK